MAAQSLATLSERARAIFGLVVETYLEHGAPVGSKTLAREGVELSPASIRSVLADLEGAGLLAAPHTSAGRMPTDAGLRLFVDGMMQVAEPSAEERAHIEQRLAEGGPVETALENASALLADLANAAGMVLVPRAEAVLAQVSFVPVGEGRALAIMVGQDGAVENRVLDLGQRLTPATLEQAANYVNARLAGRTLAEAAAQLKREVAGERTALDEASRDLVAKGLAVWSEDAARRPVLIVRGQARLIDDAALADIDRIRSLLDDLENKQAIAELLAEARDAEATRIFIGAENRLFALLSGSSVIASPYRDGQGRVVGVLGVIGPTRLNYARVVPMIDFTARQMGRLIG